LDIFTKTGLTLKNYPKKPETQKTHRIGLFLKTWVFWDPGDVPIFCIFWEQICTFAVCWML